MFTNVTAFNRPSPIPAKTTVHFVAYVYANGLPVLLPWDRANTLNGAVNMIREYLKQDGADIFSAEQRNEICDKLTLEYKLFASRYHYCRGSATGNAYGIKYTFVVERRKVEQ